MERIACLLVIAELFRLKYSYRNYSVVGIVVMETCVDDLSVAEAAQILGVSARRVRALLKSGHLPGRQVGGRWLLPSRVVEQRREFPHDGGRPLSQASAWNILAVLSGADESLADLPAPARSRARSRARDLRRPDEIAGKWPSVLASRARTGKFYGHPSVLEDLLADPRFVRSGISAAMDYNADLVVAGGVEGYVRSSDAEGLRSDYALNPDVARAQANVLLHVVHDEHAARWLFDRRLAPLAVVAADLAESDAQRDRDAGLKLAARL